MHDESYALPVAPAAGSSKRASGLHLAYAPRRRLLAVGTREKTVALYSFVGDYGSSASDSLGGADSAQQRPESTPKDWVHALTLSVAATPTSLTWDCRAEMSLAVGVGDSVSILSEAILHRKLREDVAALQVAGDHILVQRGQSLRFDRRVGILVKGIDASATHLAVWNAKKVEVYEFTQGGRMDMVGSFPSSASAVALHGQSLFQAVGSSIERAT